MLGNFVLSDELQRASSGYLFSNEIFLNNFRDEIEGYFLNEFVSHYSREHRFCEEDADETVGGVKEEGGADNFRRFDGGKWRILDDLGVGVAGVLTPFGDSRCFFVFGFVSEGGQGGFVGVFSVGTRVEFGDGSGDGFFGGALDMGFDYEKFPDTCPAKRMNSFTRGGERVRGHDH